MLPGGTLPSETLAGGMFAYFYWFVYSRAKKNPEDESIPIEMSTSFVGIGFVFEKGGKD